MTDIAHRFNDALKRTSSPGDYCTRQVVSCDDLTLSISDDVPLQFPLTKTQVRSMIKQANPASFGLKDQTLQDKSVRDTWEISKSRIKIDKRRWNKTLSALLEQVAEGLGMAEGATLNAQLHNLLIYEPGQFFLPHQDSEKTDGMVATLVVVLPSKHKGGALVIDHGGKKRTFQTSRSKLNALHCIAFYADCHHEVKPLTEGYRVTLTYNLVLTQGNVPTASEADPKPLINLLSDYFAQADQNNMTLAEDTRSRHSLSTPKWIYFLDHQYTQKSLSPALLKNQDRPRFDVICQAAKKLDCEVTLGLIELQEIWDAYPEDEIFDRYGKSLGSHSDDPAKYALNEMIDSSISLTFIAESSRKKVSSIDVSLDISQVFWVKPCAEYDPFSLEYEGWMGNYGNTLERWYHRACVILTRKSDHYTALCETQPALLVKQLITMAAKSSSRAEAKIIVQQILPYWRKANRSAASGENKWVNAIFHLSQLIRDETLAMKLCQPLSLTVLNNKTAKRFSECIQAYGNQWTLVLMKDWQSDNKHYGRQYLTSFVAFIQAFSEHSNSGEILAWLMNYQHEKLTTEFNNQRSYSLVMRKEREATRVELIRKFLSACSIAANKALHNKTSRYIEAESALFPLLAKAELLTSLPEPDHIREYPGLNKLYRSVHKTLAETINLPQRSKDNWSIHEETQCDCDLCKTLTDFLIHAEQKERVWPLAKGKRQHIHGIINGMGIPVTHVTRREGSPHKLVLKKTRDLHKNVAKQRKAEGKAFNEVNSLVVNL